MQRTGIILLLFLFWIQGIFSQVVYITKTGEKYHTIHCRYLSKSCYEISLSDAIDKGYSPCSVCDPSGGVRITYPSGSSSSPSYPSTPSYPSKGYYPRPTYSTSPSRIPSTNSPTYYPSSPTQTHNYPSSASQGPNNLPRKRNPRLTSFRSYRPSVKEIYAEKFAPFHYRTAGLLSINQVFWNAMFGTVLFDLHGSRKQIAIGTGYQSYPKTSLHAKSIFMEFQFRTFFRTKSGLSQKHFANRPYWAPFVGYRYVWGYQIVFRPPTPFPVDQPFSFPCFNMGLILGKRLDTQARFVIDSWAGVGIRAELNNQLSFPEGNRYPNHRGIYLKLGLSIGLGAYPAKVE